MTRGIHWFRNDLRLHDNLALAALAARADDWVPIFIIDPSFAAPEERSKPRVRFLFDCVLELARSLEKRGVELQILEGDPEELIPEWMASTGASLVSWTTAPTPRAKRRDLRVTRAIEKIGGEALEVLDHTVFGPDEIRTQAGGAYSVYTPFRNAWWTAWHELPRVSPRNAVFPAKPIPKSVVAGAGDSEQILSIDVAKTAARLPRGGESAAKRRLSDFLSDAASRYHIDRDRPDIEGTSRLSPYLRFGVISVRRCFTEGLQKAAEEPRMKTGIMKWLDELIWREFYHGVLAHHPHVLRHSYRSEYDEMQWSGTDAQFEAWCEGRTGYPIVDAGMRQLRETGWMHNRVRMIVASFLTKDLIIDWRRGERFFFDSLVDGDPASNNGGWQWSASTGTDAQPYFRIFNPTAQGKKWDPDGRYVRHWVPELKSVESRWIHTPTEAPDFSGDYPAPIVDHAESRRRVLDEFKRVRAIG